MDWFLPPFASFARGYDEAGRGRGGGANLVPCTALFFPSQIGAEHSSQLFCRMKVVRGEAAWYFLISTWCLVGSRASHGFDSFFLRCNQRLCLRLMNCLALFLGR